ncbi:DEAD/DEAH box helicase [Chamaesiphon sp.]|uniref:DEAD/DEAH box helicase n=1 Tax=Chamaesiphon sp. TaxID=2814140 RepID=UPI0035936864
MMSPITAYQLRPYQQSLADEAIEIFTNSASLLLQLSTGGGKTIVSAHLIDIALKSGAKCLLLAHREELITQAADKLAAIVGQEPGIIKAGYQPNYNLPIQVGSVQSMVKRLHHCPKFDLIIVDECHHATSKTYRTILNYFPTAKVLGVTATPIRLDRSGFRDIFSNMITGATTRELIDLGALSPYKYFATERSMSIVGVGKKGGDYKSSDVATANPVEGLAGDLIKAYCDYMNGKQAVVFCVNIEHSIAISAHFNAAGITAAHLDGNSTTIERSQTMTAFRAGQIKVLTNCALFDEGLDIPGLDGVILARPTASLGRYLQMVGRALRPCEGKEHAVIIDMADNWDRHGLPCDDRQWSLDGVKVKPRDKTKKLQRQPTGEVVEVEIDLTPTGIKILEIAKTALTPEVLLWFDRIDWLVSIQTEHDHRKSWCVNELLKSQEQPPLVAWKYLGKQLDYHHGWAKYKFAEWKAPRNTPQTENGEFIHDLWIIALQRMYSGNPSLFELFGTLESIVEDRAIVRMKSEAMKSIALKKVPELTSILSDLLGTSISVELTVIEPAQTFELCY